MFLEHTLQHMPNFVAVKGRLNQKMYPNVRELLISMREDDEDCSVEYYEIGQYEYIINQEICYQVIETFIPTLTPPPLAQPPSPHQLASLSNKGRQEVLRMEEEALPEANSKEICIHIIHHPKEKKKVA